MSKVVLLLILVLVNAISPQIVAAVSTCQTTPVDSRDNPITLIQNLSPLLRSLPDDQRRVYFKVGDITDTSAQYKIIWDRGVGNTEINVSTNLTSDSNNFLMDRNSNTRPFITFGGVNPLSSDIFSPTTHTFDVSKADNNQVYCHGVYIIAKDNSGGIQSCNLVFTPTQPDETSPIILTSGNIQSTNQPKAGNIQYFLKISDVKLEEIHLDGSGNITTPINFGKLNPGTYTAILQTTNPTSQNATTSIHDTNCAYNLNIASAGAGDGSITPIGSPGPGGTSPEGTTKVCKPGDPNCTSGGGKSCDSSDPNNLGISTAIGCIHTSPQGFVKDFLTFAVGISGGLAFLMMLLGAFQMLRSAGNPDSLSAGRERFKDAVIGLLIVIFAVLLMQIIGVDILNIPGFGR